MRIIRKGKVIDKQIYQCTCYNCNTEFEFYYYEAKIIKYDFNLKYAILMINCPLCSCEKRISEDINNENY